MIAVEDEWVSPFLFNFRWFSNPQLPFAVVFIFFSLLLSLQISGQQKEIPVRWSVQESQKERGLIFCLCVCVCICSKEFVFNKSHLKRNKFKVKSTESEKARAGREKK